VAAGVPVAVSVAAAGGPQARSRLVWGVFAVPSAVVTELPRVGPSGSSPSTGPSRFLPRGRSRGTNPAVLVLLGLSAQLFGETGAGFPWRFSRTGDEFLAWPAGYRA
jgi:hypothetical protein